MLTVIYLLLVLPFILTFIVGFLSYKPDQSKTSGQPSQTNDTVIAPELIQQLQKAGYIDADGKLKIFNFVLDFMTHTTSTAARNS